VFPVAGAFGLIWVIGASIAFGVMLIAPGLKLNGFRKQLLDA